MSASLYRFVLPVEDMASAARFWSELLELPVDALFPSRQYLHTAGAILALVDPAEHGQTARPNPDCVYLRVPDLDAAFAQSRTDLATVCGFKFDAYLDRLLAIAEDDPKPENKKKLAGILTYHVVPGKVLAKDVVKLKDAKTAQGSKVKIAVKEGSVLVDNAKVVKTDIPCKNGVIHVIDAVILPKETPKKS